MKLHWFGLCVVLLLGVPKAAAETLSYQQFLTNLQQKLIDDGASRTDVEQVFSDVKRFRKSSNGIAKNTIKAGKFGYLDKYLPSVVNDKTVAQARAFYKDNLAALKKLEKKYQVQPRFLVAQWGIENNFSKKTSGYDALSVITSLAHQNHDIDNTLQISSLVTLIADKPLGDVSVLSDSNGNVGLLHMSPSQLLLGYQDFDGDGISDVWNTPFDAFASGAQFLSKSGWNHSQTWGRQVALPDDLTLSILTDGQYRTLNQWNTLGVTRFDSRALPKVTLMAKLVAPDGRKGRVYLTYKNFESLLELNGTLNNTIAVGYLANRIKYPAIE